VAGALLRVPVDLRPAIPPLGEPLDFLRVIWAFDNALQRTSQRMEATLGVTAPQRMVVRILGRFPGMAAGQLAEILHIHPSTVTGLLKRLAQKGLVSRRPDPKDGRRLCLGLTAKGRKLDVHTEGSVEAAVIASLAKMDPKVIRTVRDAIVAITVALGPLEE
jgi:DNA-binding MarR family transcriptional regulator